MHHFSAMPFKRNTVCSAAPSCEKQLLPPPPQKIIDFKRFNSLFFILFILQAGFLSLSVVKAQNIGISTDATAPETGLMLDIKAPSGYPKGTTNTAQPFFQIKSFDADASALKLRFGLKTDVTQGNRYGFMEFLEAGTPTYLPLALQPTGGNVGIGTTAPADPLHVIGSGTTGIRVEGDNGMRLIISGGQAPHPVMGADAARIYWTW